MSQYATPLVLSAPDQPATPLQRVSLSGGNTAERFSEAWLQKLLFENPSILPTGEFEKAYESIIPICRELQTDAGPIDILYVTKDGDVVLVETKLWRNPEARRKVVAQVLDYATAVSRWDYEALSREVARRTKGDSSALFDIVSKAHPGLDERRFTDAVSRNLRLGQCLLLVAGDGIREGVENLAAFLDRPGLAFIFGLVEIGVFRAPDGSLFIQPRVLAKTWEYRRLVVTIVGGEARISEGERDEAAQGEVDAEGQEEATVYQEFWADLKQNYLRLSDASQPNPRGGRSKNLFFDLPPSGSKAWVSAYLAPASRVAGVYLRLASGHFGEVAWRRLNEERAAIDRELGDPPAEWWDNKDDKYSIVSRTPLNNFADESEKTRLKRWLAERANRYISAFRPRMKRIAESL